MKTIGLFIVFLFELILRPFLWFASLFASDEKTTYYHNVRDFVHHKCICDNYWYDSFKSERVFEEFESKMINDFIPVGATAYYEPKPKVTFLFLQYGAQDWEGGFIYKCKTCKNLWELSDPDNAYRGYFKGINLDLEEIKEYLKEKIHTTTYKNNA
ncbi:MAG: hypothetical protein ACQEWG_16730 [Bacteroidota bacterium]